jgi:pimeloyl-ACP methyl ester carboxylesterase
VVGGDARVEAARAAGRPEAFDAEADFLHDVPAEVAAAGRRHLRDEAGATWTEPCAFPAWPPAVPTTVLAGREDRFFPLAFQRRIARERLGLPVTEVPGGHLPALAAPRALACAIHQSALGAT